MTLKDSQTGKRSMPSWLWLMVFGLSCLDVNVAEAGPERRANEQVAALRSDQRDVTRGAVGG